jgi:hypothetical protein
MNTDPINAVNGAYIMDGTKAARGAYARDVVDLSALDASEGGAYAKVTPKRDIDAESSALNLQNVHTSISHGLKHGFVRKQIDLVAAKLADMDRPGTSVTSGSLTRDVLVLGQRLSVSDTFSKASTKLSDSLMTLVKGS